MSNITPDLMAPSLPPVTPAGSNWEHPLSAICARPSSLRIPTLRDPVLLGMERYIWIWIWIPLTRDSTWWLCSTPPSSTPRNWQPMSAHSPTTSSQGRSSTSDSPMKKSSLPLPPVPPCPPLHLPQFGDHGIHAPLNISSSSVSSSRGSTTTGYARLAPRLPCP